MKVVNDFLQVTTFLIRVSRHIRYPRILVAIAITAGIVAGVSNTGLLALINSTLTSGSAIRAGHIWAFAGLCLLLPASRFLAHILLLSFTARAMFDLRLRLCRQILGTRLRTLEELGAHRLLASLTDDVPSIANALTVLPHLCMHIAIVIGCFLYLIWLSWALFVGVLAFLTLAVLSYQFALSKALRHLKFGREEWDNLLKHFRAVTEGTKELKLHRKRREAFFERRLRPTAAALERHNVMGNKIFVGASSWGHIMFFVLIGLLLFVAPNISPVSAQTLTGYALTLLYVMVPLELLVNRLPEISRARVAVSKIEQLGLIEVGADSQDDVEESAPRWSTIEMSGVTHTYHLERENMRFSLGPIDLSFRRGELVFLTGGNGSGKTTLAKLLVGLYKPEEGEVYLDGEAVTDEVRENYRQNFSVVFSDYFLFDSLLGLENAEMDEQARRYLADLQLDHKVEINAGSLSTTDLSSGQRKRLSLLTAYLEDRPVYVFDEWAADQDPQFKEVFYYQLLPELKRRGKLVIVISHDDRFYHIADRVVKLDYGKVEYDKVTSSRLAIAS